MAKMKIKVIRRLLLLFVALYASPALFSVAAHVVTGDHDMQWHQARTDSSQQAPDPRVTKEAVVQVYAGRAFRWRGALGVHTWIAVKPTEARRYTRYEVFGWGVRRGRPAVLIGSGKAPDSYWFGSRPQILAELRGAGVDDIIRRIDKVARSYSHNHEYVVWPGPNSNTFIAHVARRVPELKLDLPPTAIGKDYIAGGGFFARSPSGTGYQVSLYGVLGLMLGIEEGIEINVLGLTFGIDFKQPALKLPGIGRLGKSV